MAAKGAGALSKEALIERIRLPRVNIGGNRLFRPAIRMMLSNRSLGAKKPTWRKTGVAQPRKAI